VPIIIGDSIGPFTYEGQCKFYPIEKQNGLHFELAKNLPFNSYTRKNLGYLIAAQEGAKIIYETDDDNFPTSSWKLRTSSQVECNTIKGNGWINSFSFFTQSKVWPRGLPLDEILKKSERAMDLMLRSVYSPVQQGLANGEPDVDAIWRLTFDQEIIFEDSNSIFLEKNTWCPFNSQSTWWHYEAYPLMYLPSNCSFRMTDIWRSFVTQRCLWEIGTGVVIHGPEVKQIRNEHNVLNDFKQEIDGYKMNRDMCRCLQDLALNSKDPFANLRKCYESWVAAGFFPKEELALVNSWENDFNRIL